MTDFTANLAQQLLTGLRLTLVLLVCCGIVGHLLAIPVALARISRRPWLRIPASGFILLLRGTPVLVQLYFAYYGVGQLLAHVPELRYGPWWPFFRDAFGYAFVALSLNTAAYAGEIWRGAISGVSAGQGEAARSLGLSRWQTTLLILLPQALRLALPALGGQTVLLLKATALTSTITVFELMGAANLVRAQTFRVYEPLVGAALFYVAITFGLTFLFNGLERRLNTGR